MNSLLGCSAAPVKNCSNCADDKLNRVIHIAYVKSGTVISEDKDQMIVDLLAAELECNALIVRQVNGEYDGGTFSDRPGRGKQDTGNGPATNNVVYTDSNYLSNSDFYASMLDAGSNYYMIFFTPEVARIAKSPLRVMPKDAVTRDINTTSEGEITVRWTSKKLPKVVLGVNDDLLNVCPELFTFDSEYLFNASGAPNSAAIVDDEITMTEGLEYDVRYDTYSDIEAVSLDESSDALPEGLEISFSGAAIVIAGTPSETGTFNLQIVGQNPCGVAGVIPVTLIVS